MKKHGETVTTKMFNVPLDNLLIPKDVSKLKVMQQEGYKSLKTLAKNKKQRDTIFNPEKKEK